MINSNDVSALIAAQNQQFAQAQSMGAVPLSQPNIGVSQFPASFSYAMPQTHTGMADRASAGVVGTVGGAGRFAKGAASAAGLGVAGMWGLGLVSPAAHAAVVGALPAGLMTGMTALSMGEPITAGISAGMGAAGALGLGAAGGAAVGLGVGGAVMGGMAATMWGAGQFMGGGRDQLAMRNLLRQNVTFGGGQGHDFRGFSYGQMGDIGAAARQFQARDPFLSMGEMNKSLVSFTDMGMHQGIRDSEEFAAKFTKMTDTLHKMARTLGTSMEGATGMFKDLRQAGFYSASDVIGQTTQMGVLRGQGMSYGQAMGVTAAGAGISRGAQMSGISGAKAATGFAQMIMQSPEMLTGVTQESMMDLYGVGSMGEAATAGSQRLTGALARFLSEDPAGKAILMNVGTMEGGRFTGGVDASKVQGILGGGTGLQDLTGRGMNRLGSSMASRTSFKTRSKDIAQELLSNEDAMMAIIKTMENSAQYFGMDSNQDDIVEILLTERLGLDRREARYLQETMKKYDQVKAASSNKLIQEAKSTIARDYIARERSVQGLMRQLGGSISDIFGAPLGQMGADVTTGISMGVQRVTDSALGITRWSPSASTQASMSGMLLDGTARQSQRGHNWRGAFDSPLLLTGVKSMDEFDQKLSRISKTGVALGSDLFGSDEAAQEYARNNALTQSQLDAIANYRATAEDGGLLPDAAWQWGRVKRAFGGKDAAVKGLAAHGYGDIAAAHGGQSGKIPFMDGAMGGYQSAENLIKQGQQEIDDALSNRKRNALIGASIGAAVATPIAPLAPVAALIGGAVGYFSGSSIDQSTLESLKTSGGGAVASLRDEGVRKKWGDAFRAHQNTGDGQYLERVQASLTDAGLDVSLEEIETVRVLMKQKGSLDKIVGDTALMAGIDKLQAGGAGEMLKQSLSTLDDTAGVFKGAGLERNLQQLQSTLKSGQGYETAISNLLNATSGLSESRAAKMKETGFGGTLLALSRGRGQVFGTSAEMAEAMLLDQSYVSEAMSRAGMTGSYEGLTASQKKKVSEEAASLGVAGLLGGGGANLGVVLDNQEALQRKTVEELVKLAETNTKLAGYVENMTVDGVKVNLFQRYVTESN